MQSLKLYIGELRDKFEGFELKAKAESEHSEYQDEQRRVAKKSTRISGRSSS